MIERLKERVNGDARLVHRGRFVNTSFLLEIGADTWLIHIVDGRIESVARGPMVMPRWTFALRASAEAWEKFCLPAPPPGFHDLLALVKFGRLKVEGDMHPFMANLFYFKALLASVRGLA